MRVGITDHAQHLLGDMVFIELPALHRVVKSGEECAVAESVKAAADVYSPLSGEVTAINNKLLDSPETINADPYGSGWLYALQPSQPQELQELLDSASYAKLISEEA